MLEAAILLALSVNGGVFAGTIAYTAYKSFRIEQVIGYAERLSDLPFQI